MPPLSGFSDNSLRTRQDVVGATEAFLKPLLGYFSVAGARVRLPVGSGVHFDETAAQLEGFARPLWAIGALLMSGEPNWAFVQPWINGLEIGSDPDHTEYWGTIKDYDQRMVEAEMISFSLLAAPRALLWDRLSAKTQGNLATWLLGMYGKQMPQANWLWFRVFASLALIRVVGVDTSEIRSQMKIDLEQLDRFYLGDGWSSDGLWRSVELDEEELKLLQNGGRANGIPSGRSADYYSGSFAIQFSQLLYVRFAADLDIPRAERYRQHAREFGAGFWRFFDAEGAVIPFGRSLTYRFACAAYFAALALADVPGMPEPLAIPGAIKGFLLRHLRWWARHSAEIFYPDGTMNQGWLYPNMYMTEDYNSPQSVYWALKSLVVVALPANHPFWADVEVPYPALTPSTAVKILPAPRQILCNHPWGNHHFMLSTAQFLGIHFKAAVAKYCKFAYSSAFGFSVPTGHYSLQQIAPDNMLALSRDGTETWTTKYKCGETEYGTAMIKGSAGDEVVTATVTWYPWVDRSVVVRTTLIPPNEDWPDWHVRIHWLKAMRPCKMLIIAEGGFAINGRCQKDGSDVPTLSPKMLDERIEVGLTEGIVRDNKSILMLSCAGASGVSAELLPSGKGVTTVAGLKPEANTNLITQRTIIPIAEHTLKDLEAGTEVCLVTKVFAVSSSRCGGSSKVFTSLKNRWLQRPYILVEEPTSTEGHGRIHVHTMRSPDSQ